MIASSGSGEPLLGDHLVHHVPQPDAAGVVLHPARLEGGVLAAVGEDDELLVALRGGVDHRLGEDVNVGDRDRLDLPGRFDRPARRSGRRACCTTGRPTGSTRRRSAAAAAPDARSRRPGSAATAHGASPRTGGRTTPSASARSGRSVPRRLPPAAGWSSTSRVPFPSGDGDQKAFSCPSSSWVALPFSNPRIWFLAPRANSRSRTCFSKKCWPQLRQVRIGRKASSWRPGNCSLASFSDRNRSQLGVGLGAVQGDHHLVQAPQEEVDLGPQERLAALQGGSAQDQVGEEFGVRLVALGEPAHGNPLRGLPGGLVEPLGDLQDLRGLEDVLVGRPGGRTATPASRRPARRFARSAPRRHP